MARKGNVINLIGKKFGRLTVISLSKDRGNFGQYKWNCVCDCGKKHLVTGESLRANKSKSCGCLLHEARYAKNDNTDRVVALLKLLYSPLKKRHKKKFLIQTIISFNEFKILSFSKCFYCGVKPINKLEDVRYEPKYKKLGKIKVTDTVIYFNGIDRIDSTKGYESGNVLPCCKYCNTAKNSLRIDEFKDLIKKIYKHWAGT